MRAKLLLTMGLVALSSMASAVEYGGAAKYFSAVTPGVVKDNRTGLEWMRCRLGQDWNEVAEVCLGKVRKYTWQEALDIPDKLNAMGG